MAHEFYRALTMDQEERRRRMGKLRMQVREANIYRWAAQVLSALFRCEFAQR
jgi:trehalose-6-phosphate synthase